MVDSSWMCWSFWTGERLQSRNIVYGSIAINNVYTNKSIALRLLCNKIQVLVFVLQTDNKDFQLNGITYWISILLSYHEIIFKKIIIVISSYPEIVLIYLWTFFPQYFTCPLFFFSLLVVMPWLRPLDQCLWLE